MNNWIYTRKSFWEYIDYMEDNQEWGITDQLNEAFSYIGTLEKMVQNRDDKIESYNKDDEIKDLKKELSFYKLKLKKAEQINSNLRDDVKKGFKEGWDIWVKRNIIEEENKNREKRKPKTYLMSHINGLTKIGKSVNPRAREKTLQSEDPHLRLIWTSCDISEKELHKKYERKRIRGEWFDLAEEDIKEIMETK